MNKERLRKQRARRSNLATGIGIGAIIGLLMVCAAIFGFWASQALPNPVAAITPTAPPTLLPVTPTAIIATPTPPLAVAPQPTVTPSSTPGGNLIHIVQSGEILTSIAEKYGVTVEDILAANEGITDPDNIQPGMKFIIPNAALPVTTSPVATPVTVIANTSAPTQSPVAITSTAVVSSGGGSLDWPASLISGDLDNNYPLTQMTASGRIKIHYQPGSYTALNIDLVSTLADQALGFDESKLGGQLKPQVDLYIGGTLFNSNPALQGYTQSVAYRSFVLIDGAYNQGEAEYILAHELTHMVSTHTFGTPSSTMLHEGLGTYLPQTFLTQDGGYLSHKEFCSAAYQNPSYFRSAVKLGELGYGASGFGGHVRSFINYNLSACFVGHLIETYGMDKLRQVYSSGDYTGVYGRSLAQLDQDWQAALATAPLTIDGARFLSLEDKVAAAYESYFASLGSDWRHSNWQAYQHLVHARTLLHQGNLDEAQSELGTFNSLMGF